MMHSGLNMGLSCVSWIFFFPLPNLAVPISADHKVASAGHSPPLCQYHPPYVNIAPPPPLKITKLIFKHCVPVPPPPP